MARWAWMLILIGMAGLMMVPLVVAGTLSQEGQPALPEVYVEAKDRANLRSGAGTNYDIVGEIIAGTRYRVLKQHEYAPWLLLEMPALPTRAGWVFTELVNVVQGNLFEVPYESSYNELIPVDPSVPQAVNPAATVPAPTGDALTVEEVATSIQQGSATATIPAATPAAPAADLVIAVLQGRTNIRFGPGTDYPVIQTLDAGAIMVVLATHSNFPWLKVAIEGAPNGEGWVLREIVEIQGNDAALPVISELTLPYPTPSATPQVVVSNNAPWEVFGDTDSRMLIAQLGEPIYNFMLSNGLAPRSDEEGSVFAMNLETGEHFTINGGVAYSGMSTIKIPIAIGYFVHKQTPLSEEDAVLIANTLICSENITTNRMLAFIGDGNAVEGALRVSEMLQALGLRNSFVSAPLWTGEPNATPVPASSMTTEVDQARTQPDPFNQITVEEMGWLLGSLYQCAEDGTGPLVDTFADRITETECRQIVRAMMGNKIGALLEVGTPDNTPIAHKHGWINDTHGDAGIVFGPDADFVLVMTYHERIPNELGQLESGKTFPVLEEITRRVWNHFNPSAAIGNTIPKQGNETCNIYGESVIAEMLSGTIELP